MKKTPIDMNAGCRHKSRNFGWVEVVKYHNAFNVEVVFLNTMQLYTFEAGNIRKGNIKDLMQPTVCDVGFIGKGPHKVRVDNKLTKAYQTWSDMMKRCYSPKRQEKQPTYTGCLVCDDWHNYQNFAEWYCENLPDDSLRYEVDKDIKKPGNKVYSPEFCTIVSARENRQESNARNATREYKIINPDGNEVVVVNMAKYCRENSLDKSGMSALFRGKLKSYKGYTLP